MSDRFADEAGVTVTRAAQEARRRGDRRLGTDHLLVAALEDRRMATAAGVTADAARTAVDALDRAALAAIGVSTEGFVPGAGPQEEHIALSSGARQVARRTLAHRAARKARHIHVEHVLLALLEREAPDPAAVLLDELGVDRAAVSHNIKEVRA
jgi:ATP-dependent Clp protease ATP-binding subunit ClpA